MASKVGSSGKRKRGKRAKDVEVSSPPTGSDVRAKLLATLEEARKPITAVEDVPGGGFKLIKGDPRQPKTEVVRGLHAALKERVYSEGPPIGWDYGPSSSKYGELVHRHVYHLVECLKFGRECKCGSKFRSEKMANKSAREVLRVLRVNGLVPVASEVVLLAPAWNLATRADLVCANKEGKIVLVSLKTGACNTLLTGRCFRGDLEEIADTASARHQAQLAAEVIMMEAAGVKVTFAFVLYARPSGKPEDTETRDIDRRLFLQYGREALDALLRNVPSK